MHRYFWIILFCSILVWAAKSPPIPAKAPEKTVLLNGIAAEISGKPTTVEEVYLHHALERVRQGQLPLLNLDSADVVHAWVQKFILDRIVLDEMKSLDFESTPKSDAAQILAERKKNKPFKIEWDKLLNYFKMTEDKALNLLWRNQQAEKFLEKKVETLTPLITQEELTQYLNTHNPGWEKQSDDEKRELRTRTERLLKKDHAELQIRDWIVRLKRKYSVVQYL